MGLFLEGDRNKAVGCVVCRNKRRRNWLDYPPLPATDLGLISLFYNIHVCYYNKILWKNNRVLPIIEDKKITLKHAHKCGIFGTFKDG